MTPAIKLLEKLKIPHKVHVFKAGDSSLSWGLEAAEIMGVSPGCVFKTLVTADPAAKSNLFVGIVPVANSLNLKRLAKAAGVKRLEMANPVIAQKTTGYILGGISPVGQKKQLPTYLDSSANRFDTIFVSGGKRGLELEMSPSDLLEATRGQFASLVE